jgi:hypothetical protein
MLLADALCDYFFATSSEALLLFELGLTFCRTPITPLFEVEGDAAHYALIPKMPKPLRMHRARFCAAFTTGDYPVDLGRPLSQIEESEQGFARQKQNSGRISAKLLNPSV